METVRAVLFDLDGTLFDYAGSVDAALRSWLPEIGVAAEADVLLRWVSLEREHYPASRDGLISWTEHRRLRLRAFLDAVGLPALEDAGLDEMFAGYLRSFEASYRCFADAAPTLRRAREAGLATAVLTNGSTQRQTGKLEATGLLPLCGTVFSSELLGAPKPRPEAYLEACARLGSSPGETLIVGDDHEADVLGARACGLAAVHLDRTGDHPVPEARRIRTLERLEFR